MLPWNVFSNIHTSVEKFQAGSCSHHPIVQTKIICLEPWAPFCMHLLPKNQLIAMTVNFARANSADHVFGITLAYELECTKPDQVLEFLSYKWFSAKSKTPYLFTHPNPINEIVSWSIRWQSITIFLFGMVWFAN